MLSRAPVASPTEIIWVTMGGKTLALLKGSARVLPSLTLCRVARTASSTTLLPAVRATINSPSRIGTPLEMSVPRVRVNFATATFRMSTPTTGTLSAMPSVIRFPVTVFLHCTRPTMNPAIEIARIRPPHPLRKLLMKITMRVGSGRAWPISANMPASMGTTTTIRRATTPTATLRITEG